MELFEEIKIGSSIPSSSSESPQSKPQEPPKLFDIQTFYNHIRDTHHISDVIYQSYSEYINAYDISSNCIRTSVYRLLGYPLPNFTPLWIGLLLRAELGKAIHAFIQNNYPFTETEVSLFVPSLHVSVRLDALLGTTTLIEIKSMSYRDFQNCVTNKTCRKQDLIQAIFYKYLLENYLFEIKENTTKNPPQQDNYKISHIQLIYVAHDINTSDLSLDQAIQEVRRIRRMLKYYESDFIYVYTYDASNCQEYLDYVTSKLDRILHYYRRQQIPPLTDPFIDRTKCGFCPYKSVCEEQG